MKEDTKLEGACDDGRDLGGGEEVAVSLIKIYHNMYEIIKE